MSKTETVFARLKLNSYDKHVQLVERRSEINERLFDVLDDDFYAKIVTDKIVELYPEKLQTWLTYRDTLTSERPREIGMVGKFLVTGQKVDLVEIRFY